MWRRGCISCLYVGRGHKPLATIFIGDLHPPRAVILFNYTHSCTLYTRRIRDVRTATRFTKVRLTMHGKLKRRCRSKIVNDTDDGKLRLRNVVNDGLRKGRGSWRHCGRRWRTREGEIFDPVEQKAASPLE